MSELVLTGVAEQNSLFIKGEFQQYLERLDEYAEIAKSLEVTKATDREGMKAAKEARAVLRDIRINADKKRKELKAESLAYGKGVQAVYNSIAEKIKPIESYLEEQEKFVEFKRKKREAAIHEKRMAEMSVYDPVYSSMFLGALTKEEYQEVVNDAEEGMREAERVKNLDAENRKLKEQARERSAKIEKLEESIEKIVPGFKVEDEVDARIQTIREKLAATPGKKGGLIKLLDKIIAWM